MKYQRKDIQKSLFKLLIHLQQHQYQESGYSLVLTIAMILIVTSLLVTASVMGKIENSSKNAVAKSSKGFYAAEAGLNRRAEQIRGEFDDFNLPSGTSPDSWQACVDADNTNDGSDDLACDNSLTFQGQNIATYVEDVTGGVAQEIVLPSDDIFGGLSAQEYRYDVVSVARDSQDLPTAILGMRFKSRLIPLFQFAAFYEQDMDFAIPPSMTVNGRVHSNNDLYLSASNSGTFTINGEVTTAGDLYRGEKIQNTCGGTVNIYDPTNSRTLTCSSGRQLYAQADVSDWNNQIQIGIDPLNVPEPDEFNASPGSKYWDKADLRIVLELDSSNDPVAIEVRNQDNTVNSTATTNLLNNCPVTEANLQNEGASDSEYELNDTVINVNNTSGFNDGDIITVGSDYDSNVITSHSSNTITLKRQLGHSSYQSNPVVTASGSSVKVREAVVSTSDTFYNYREKNGGNTADDGTFIRMLNVDMGLLFDCIHDQSLMGATGLNDATDGGLVWFFTVDGPDSNTDVTAGGSPNNYGVRLYNAQELASSIVGASAIQGLTVISDQAVYTQGNYNSTNKKPAAILADTINVLSEAWPLDDSYSRGYSSNLPTNTTYVDDRQASTTTINAAFLAGIDISGGANQEVDPDGNSTLDGGWSTSGGGWNNYPRFHERWSSIPLNYSGSMVTLGAPRRANGPYCGSVSIAQSAYGSDICNIYRPPTRNWDYDTTFNNAANLPPLTPRAVYLRQELFEREFDQASAQPRQSQLKFASLFPFNFLGLLRPPQLSLYKGLQGR